MLILDPQPKVITFDCYGTLVQWHRAVQDVARTVIALHDRQGDEGNHHADGTGADERAIALAARLREVAMELQGRDPFQDYKAVLQASLEQAAAEMGHQATAEDREALLSTMRRIEPHPEVPAALHRLRGRYRLGIISNTDDDLIAGTVDAIGAPIDFVVTAQQAKAYKPDHRLFRHAHASMGVSPAETVHVGMGQFTDMKVCHELGIRAVWINRAGETASPDWPSQATMRTLSDLPELLQA